MNVQHCKRCGKIYKETGGKLCPICIKELDAEFEKVRNFLYDNPNSVIETIVEETGVSEKIIRNWLREGRLILGDDHAALLNCQGCGIPIVTGKMCEKCISRLKNATSGWDDKYKPNVAGTHDSGQKVSGKMHVKVRNKSI